jgi:ribulose-5-phosphate 4-epimerase/fuculose-1-phosphate aldolase
MTATIGASATAYRELVARAVRICHTAKVMDFNGHVSIRDENDRNVMWINSRKASRSTLTGNDIVPVDLAAGVRIGPGDEPPSEYHIHREIYKRRPDVGSIVHSHPEFINTLSIAQVKLRWVITVNPFIPDGGAPVFDSPVLICTEARGAALAQALGDANIVVMRQHGTVTVGTYVKEAVVRMMNAEDNARQLFHAMQVGTPYYIPPGELNELRKDNVALAAEKFWHYWEETARDAGALNGIGS